MFNKDNIFDIIMGLIIVTMIVSFSLLTAYALYLICG